MGWCDRLSFFLRSDTLSRDPKLKLNRPIRFHRRCLGARRRANWPRSPLLSTCSTHDGSVMSVTICKLTVQADLTVTISRHAPGDLEAGVRRQLERIAGVSVRSLTLCGLQPGLNDLTVEAHAELLIDDIDEIEDSTSDAVAARLASGFGVSPQQVRIQQQDSIPDR